MRFAAALLLTVFLSSSIAVAAPPNTSLNKKLLKLLEAYPSVVEEIVPRPTNLRDLDGKAILDLRIKAQHGEPNSLLRLGTLCLYSIVQEQTCRPASWLQMFRSAAGKGLVQVQVMLAKLFEFGSIQESGDIAGQYLEEAYYWYSQATFAGDQRAQKDRERLANRMPLKQRASLDALIEERRRNPPHATTVHLK